MIETLKIEIDREDNPRFFKTNQLWLIYTSGDFKLGMVTEIEEFDNIRVTFQEYGTSLRYFERRFPVDYNLRNIPGMFYIDSIQGFLNLIKVIK